MSVNSDFAGWAEPETDLMDPETGLMDPETGLMGTELMDLREAESGRHRADTVSNGISVEELLVRAGQARN